MLAAGKGIGLSGGDFELGVRQGRYEPWVVEMEQVFAVQDPQGTPGLLDGVEVELETLYQPEALGMLIRG